MNKTFYKAKPTGKIVYLKFHFKHNNPVKMFQEQRRLFRLT